MEHLVWVQGSQVQILSSRYLFGALAQLGERLPRTQEVSGSIPLGSTKSSLKTEQGTNNVKRQFLFYDARQTNFIGEFDPGSG